MKISMLLIAALFSSTLILAQINGVYENNQALKAAATPFCDSLIRFPVIDPWPTGIAFDGQYLWTCGSGTDQIVKYDTLGNFIDSISNPSNLYGSQGLIFDGDYLWTLAEQEDVLYKFSPINGYVLGQYSVPANANGWGLAYSGSHLYSTDYIDSVIYKIVPSSGQIIDSIQTDRNFLGIEFVNGSLYGISADFNKLLQIDVMTGHVTDSLDWCIDYPLGLTWDGEHLWNVSSSVILGGQQKVYKMDLSLFNSVGISNHEISSSELLISPNPASERVRLEISGYRPGRGMVQVYSVTGHLFFTKPIEIQSDSSTLDIDISAWPNGLYMVRLRSEAASINYKLLVQN